MEANSGVAQNTLPLCQEQTIALIDDFLNKNTLPLMDFFKILFRLNFLRSKVFREAKKVENLCSKQSKENLNGIFLLSSCQEN